MAGKHYGVTSPIEISNTGYLPSLGAAPPVIPGSRMDRAYAEGRGQNPPANPHRSATPEFFAWGVGAAHRQLRSQQIQTANVGTEEQPGGTEQPGETPEPPGTLQQVSSTQLDWNNSPTSGVTYRVYRVGQVIAETIASEYNELPRLVPGAYWVTAVKSGRESKSSNSVLVRDAIFIDPSVI